MAIILYS